MLFPLCSYVQLGDAVIFNLSISRTDETIPVYGITLTAVIYHPFEEVLITLFDPAMVASIENDLDEVRTTLALPQLNYNNLEEPAVGDQSTFLLTFNGTVNSLAYTVLSIQLEGQISFETAPTNGHQYCEMFSFPEIFIRDANFSLELISTSFDSTQGPALIQDEEALFRASVTDIHNFGESANLTLSLEIDDYLHFVLIEIDQIGYVPIFIAIFFMSRLRTNNHLSNYLPLHLLLIFSTCIHTIITEMVLHSLVLIPLTFKMTPC